MRRFALPLFVALLAMTLSLLSTLLATGPALARTPQQIPDWFLQDVEHKTRDGGVWIADNSEYRDEDEGTDAYGIEWRPGIGGKSMVGRLFGIRDGDEIGTYWEFRSFWHPVQGAVHVYQYGAQGTLGYGELARDEDGLSVLEQTFAWPDGTVERIRHETRSEGDRDVGRSFEWVDGEWQPRRSYTWVRQTPGGDPLP